MREMKFHLNFRGRVKRVSRGFSNMGLFEVDVGMLSELLNLLGLQLVIFGIGLLVNWIRKFQ